MDWTEIGATALEILPVEGWVALAMGLAAGAWLARWLYRLRERWRTWRSRRLGQRGESRALKLLQRAGYAIVEEQVEGRTQVVIDGKTQEYVVRADVMVERQGERFIAEVKAGPEASRVSNRNTRRQLLEYACAYDVRGVLLVDAHSGTIHTVEFPALSQD